MSEKYKLGPVTAYGIAVEHGFQGTEQEWLDSLHPTDAQIQAYFEANPAQRVMDGSVTRQKLAADVTGQISGLEEDIEDVRQSLTSPFNFKGSVASASDLPDEGNTVNDTYYVEDVMHRVSWTGETDGWKQSSMAELEYEDVLGSLAGDIEAMSEPIDWETGLVSGEYVLGYYAGAESYGGTMTSANWTRTDYVTVRGYARIWYNRPASTAASTGPTAKVGMCFYDRAHDPIPAGQCIITGAAAKGVERTCIDVPEGAVFARFSEWAGDYSLDLRGVVRAAKDVLTVQKLRNPEVDSETPSLAGWGSGIYNVTAAIATAMYAAGELPTDTPGTLIVVRPYIDEVTILKTLRVYSAGDRIWFQMYGTAAADGFGDWQPVFRADEGRVTVAGGVDTLKTGLCYINAATAAALFASASLPADVPGVIFTLRAFNGVLEDGTEQMGSSAQIYAASNGAIYARSHASGSRQNWNPWRLTGEASDRSGLTAAYRPYLDRRIAQIRFMEEEAGLGNFSSFLFFTDYHYNNNSRDTAGIINYVGARTGAGAVLCAGDLINNTSNGTASAQIAELCGSFSLPFFVVNGNHDDNNNHQTNTAEMLSDAAMYGLLHSRNNLIQRQGGLNFYTDDPNGKIRYVFLGCVDDTDCTLVPGAVDWLRDTALADVPDGWMVIVVTHNAVWFDGGSPNYQALSEAEITAAQADIVGIVHPSFAGAAAVLDSYNASHAGSKVIAVLAGHNHIDLHAKTAGGIPVVSTTTDSFESVYSEDDGTRYTKNRDGTDRNGRKRTYGAAGPAPDDTTVTIPYALEQAIDYVIVNRAARSITMVRLGNGHCNGYTDLTMEVSKVWTGRELGARVFSFAGVMP